MKKIAIILFMLFIPSLCLAAFFDGNKILEFCGSSYNNDNPSCGGFIMGTVDGHDTMVLTTSAKPYYCLPANINSTQLIKISVIYLNDHPEQTHYAAASLVYHALREAFPCN